MQPIALNTDLGWSFWASLGSSVSQIGPIYLNAEAWCGCTQEEDCGWAKDKHKGLSSHPALEANGSHYSASCHPAAHARPGAGSVMCWQPGCGGEKKLPAPSSRPVRVRQAFSRLGPQPQARLTVQRVSSVQQQWQQRSTQHPGLHLCANRASFKRLNRRLICYWEIKAIEASPIQSSGFCFTLAPGIFLAKLPTMVLQLIKLSACKCWHKQCLVFSHLLFNCPYPGKYWKASLMVRAYLS